MLWGRSEAVFCEAAKPCRGQGDGQNALLQQGSGQGDALLLPTRELSTASLEAHLVRAPSGLMELTSKPFWKKSAMWL